VVEQAVLTRHLQVVSSGHDRSTQINDNTIFVDVVGFCAGIAFFNHLSCAILSTLLLDASVRASGGIAKATIIDFPGT